MKNKFLTVPIMALMMFSLLFFWIGCKKTENIEQEQVQEQESSLQEYVQGVWVIDSSMVLPVNPLIFSNDTIKFATNTVYFSCREETLNYSAHGQYITIYAASGENQDYRVERMSDNQMKLHGYSPCYDYTQVVSSTVFNRIN